MTTPACDCSSYNRPDRGGDTPETIIDPRPHFAFATKTVCVDACIADVILRLWQSGIWTRGCCCGHNRQHPSVMIDNPKDCEPTAEILRQDGRNWQILVWAAKGGDA